LRLEANCRPKAQLALRSPNHPQYCAHYRQEVVSGPAAWIAQQRLERARTLLRITALPLAQVAEQCGYANASHFSHRFRESVGVAPTAFRQAVGA
jgi:AraC family transcriptional regulator